MSNQYPGAPGQPPSPYGGQPNGEQPAPGGWGQQQPGSQPSAPPYGQPASQPSAPPYGQPASQPAAPPYGQPASQPSAPQFGNQPSYGNQPAYGNQPPNQPPPGPQPPYPGPAPSFGTVPANPTQGAFGSPASAGYMSTPTTQMGTAYDAGATWQQPAQAVPPPPKKSALPKVLLFVGIGVVVLALVIGGFAFWNHQQQVEADKRVVQSATDTVQGYLDAVAAGDADKALGYAKTKPSGPLLAPEVVKAAVKDGAVSGVAVEPAEAAKNKAGDWTTATVRASWTIDGKSVSRTFPLTRSGEAWTIDKVTATVQLGTTTLPFTVNGATVSGSSTEALPGKYTVASGNPTFQFASPTFVVSEPGTQVKWLADSAPTDKAFAEAKAALVKSYQTCLKETRTVKPAGCPFGFTLPAGVALDAGSVRFTAPGDPFASAKFERVDDATYTMKILLLVTVKATGKRGTQALALSGTQPFAAVATVNLSSKKYSWEYGSR